MTQLGYVKKTYVAPNDALRDDLQRWVLPLVGIVPSEIQGWGESVWIVNRILSQDPQPREAWVALVRLVDRMVKNLEANRDLWREINGRQPSEAAAGMAREREQQVHQLNSIRLAVNTAAWIADRRVPE